MRVDAHVHVWAGGPTASDVREGTGVLDRRDTVERLRPLAATAGIDAAVAVQTVGSEAETERLLALAAGEPFIGGVVGWVDLAAADVATRLDRLRAGAGGERLVGIRTMLPATNAAVPEPALRRGMRALADCGLTLDLLLSPEGLPRVRAVADAMPELRIVVDHLAKPSLNQDELQHWERGIRVLAERRNIAVKLSGLLTQLGPTLGTDALMHPVSVALDAFGGQRAMIGSDWPLCEPFGGYERAITAMERLAAECGADAGLVSGGTAAAWYGLAVRAQGES
ncbi:amidohydrolase family protein [Humibacter ginsengisoli]